MLTSVSCGPGASGRRRLRLLHHSAPAALFALLGLRGESEWEDHGKLRLPDVCACVEPTSSGNFDYWFWAAVQPPQVRKTVSHCSPLRAPDHPLHNGPRTPAHRAPHIVLTRKGRIDQRGSTITSSPFCYHDSQQPGPDAHTDRCGQRSLIMDQPPKPWSCLCGTSLAVMHTQKRGD